jgi:hypothetical protein
VIAALAAALALIAQAGAAPGPEARSVPLERVFPFWVDYLDLPADERSAFKLDYVLSERSGAESSYWVETSDGFEPLERDLDGGATPPAPAAFEAGGRLFTDAPEGGVAVAMRLSLSAAPAREYSIETLEAALAQAANATRALMGLRAVFMPRLDTVRFSFDGAAPRAVVVYRDGREAPLETVYGDVITVQPRDSALRGAAAIRFGAPPTAAVLETGR